jgi:3-oxoacyl-[acyl-carrier-protein] synthase-3
MYTKARAIHRAAIADTPALLQEALAAAGLEIGDVDCVIPHQTSARAIRKGMRVLGDALGGLPRHPAVVTVDRYGNTASTTHVVALVEELGAGPRGRHGGAGGTGVRPRDRRGPVHGGRGSGGVPCR